MTSAAAQHGLARCAATTRHARATAARARKGTVRCHNCSSVSHRRSLRSLQVMTWVAAGGDDNENIVAARRDHSRPTRRRGGTALSCRARAETAARHARAEAARALTTQPKDRRPPEVFFLGACWCSCYKKKYKKERKPCFAGHLPGNLLSKAPVKQGGRCEGAACTSGPVVSYYPDHNMFDSSAKSEICVLLMNTRKRYFWHNLWIFFCGAVARDDRTPRRWELACFA